MPQPEAESFGRVRTIFDSAPDKSIFVHPKMESAPDEKKILDTPLKLVPKQLIHFDNPIYVELGEDTLLSTFNINKHIYYNKLYFT